MYLFESWKESFLFLKPKNLKLLGLVTLRILASSYLFFAYAILLFMFFDNNLWGLFGIRIPEFNIIQKILLIDLFFLFILVTRPSVKKKSISYFLDYIRHFIIWFCISLVLYPMLDLIVKYGFWGILFNLVAFPLEIFFILFFLDSRLGVKNFFSSFQRACKMFFFNLPFIIIIFLVPYYFVFSYVHKIPIISKYINLLFLIGYICLFTNFYVKRLHDQFRIYFHSMFVHFIKYAKEYFFSLMKSWKTSLAFLKPKTFQSFTKEALVTMVSGYKVWFTYFSFLLIFYILPHFVGGPIPVFLHYISYVFIFFTLILCFRSTEGEKNFSYFWGHKMYLFVFFFAFLVMVFRFLFSILFAGVSIFIKAEVFENYPVYNHMGIVLVKKLVMYMTFISPILYFLALFIVDDKKHAHNIFISLGRATKMALFNYPFCFAIAILLLPLDLFVNGLFFFDAGEFWSSLLFVFYKSLFMAFMVTLYKKIIEKHYDFYFNS